MNLNVQLPWRETYEQLSPETWRIIVFAVLMLLLVGMMASRTFGGINPDSLWLDDQWVMTLVMHAGMTELFELMPPAPIGFIILLKLITGILGEGHWQLQLLPYLCGLAQVPLLGWIAWRATGRLSLGVLAALLLSASETQLIFMLRIKQYTVEGLIALVLIALAMWCVRRGNARPFFAVAIAAVIALPFSFTAIPVGMVIVNVLALHLMGFSAFGTRHSALGIRHSDSRSAPLPIADYRMPIVGASFYNTAALIWLWFVQRHQANDVMHAFWSRYYLPLGDAELLQEFATSHLMRFLTGAMPPLLGWLMWAVPLAIVLLLLMSRTRLIGLALVLFYGGMVALSAMELYPLGGRRTDIFSYPITLLAIAAGIWAISRWISFLPHAVLIIVVGWMILLPPTTTFIYPQDSDRRVVDLLAEQAHDADGIIIGPRSNWAVGCYGPWQVDLERARTSSNGFIVLPHRERLIALPERLSEELVPLDLQLLAGPLEPLLEKKPQRIWVLSIHDMAWWLPEILEGRGYRRIPSPARHPHLRLYEASVPSSELSLPTAHSPILPGHRL